MSVQAISWAYAQSCPSPLAKFLLITLANYANETGECWPSKSRVANDMGCSESSVCKHLGVLQDAGMIEVRPRFFGGVQVTSRIRLLANEAQNNGVRHTDPVVRLRGRGGPPRGHKPSMNRQGSEEAYQEEYSTSVGSMEVRGADATLIDEVPV